MGLRLRISNALIATGAWFIDRGVHLDDDDEHISLVSALPHAEISTTAWDDGFNAGYEARDDEIASKCYGP